MTVGLLIFIEYIPNTNPPLFFVLLNLYIGFFIPLEMLKILFRKNHIKRLFSKSNKLNIDILQPAA